MKLQVYCKINNKVHFIIFSHFYLLFVIAVLLVNLLKLIIQLRKCVSLKIYIGTSTRLIVNDMKFRTLSSPFIIIIIIIIIIIFELTLYTDTHFIRVYIVSNFHYVTKSRAIKFLANVTHFRFDSNAENTNFIKFRPVNIRNIIALCNWYLLIHK